MPRNPSMFTPSTYAENHDYLLAYADHYGMITEVEPFHTRITRTRSWVDGLMDLPATAHRRVFPFGPGRRSSMNRPGPDLGGIRNQSGPFSLSDEGNAMKRRPLARMVARLFSSNDRRSALGQLRQNRPCLDRLESRRLLATVAEFQRSQRVGLWPRWNDGRAGRQHLVYRVRRRQDRRRSTRATHAHLGIPASDAECRALPHHPRPRRQPLVHRDAAPTRSA